MKSLPLADCTRRILPVAACLILAVQVAAGSDSASPVPTKDHSLFVGQDIHVLVDGEYRLVTGAGTRSFVVAMDGRPREIPTRKATALRIARGLKLSNVSASIANVRGVMSSDAASAEQMEVMQDAMAISTLARIQQDRLQVRAVVRAMEAATVRDTRDPDAAMKAVAQAESETLKDMIAAQPGLDRMMTMAHDEIIAAAAETPNTGDVITLVPEVTRTGVRLSVSGTGTIPAKAASGAAGSGGTLPPVRNAGGERSDRLDVEFVVSAPRPLDDAYVMLVTEYTAPEKPGEVFRRVLPSRLGRIDEKPRKVKLYSIGYPSGFHLARYSIALYTNGQEVATNYSTNPLPLTRDEAYQYVVLDYLVAHKGETSPPAAVLMSPRSELQRHASNPEFRQPVYVSIDKAGKLIDVSADESGSRRVSPAVSAALNEFRFIPALDKGACVDGRARLVLADFLHQAQPTSAPRINP